ncbi:ABC transporter substrate-binding protein [Bailinhaonella thermotolerans]|uniref:ABC transporter substrate-binding protein n=1 Tax=Bailinhaonella thermotolerans TaxID=1070861 RepID=A0A3A4AF39_9ACTN|nr:ABC transporter substrate-binding protein [Bailinhaonella thermotolerans]
MAALLPAAAACGSAAKAGAGGPGTVTELRYQGQAGAVGFAELAQDLGYLDGVRLKWVGNTTSGPQDIQSVATGQTDFGAAFNGAIIKLRAARAPIRAVAGWYGADDKTHVGFFVKEDSPIRNARDLIGKKVGVNTLGAHFEAATKEYLRRGGLTPEEAEQVQLVVVPPVSTEQALRQGQIDVAALSGVLRDKALERGGVRALYTDFALFGPFTGGAVVFREDFVARNRDVVEKFVAGYAKAVRWTQTHTPAEVIERSTKIIQKRGRNEDASNVRYWKSSGLAAPGGVLSDQDFQRWIDWLVREGEIRPGQVKPGDVYTNEFNPFASGTGVAS